MRLHGNSERRSNHSQRARRIQRVMVIAVATCLVILLNGCASVSGSADCDPWEYNPNTGYPAVGSRSWHL